MRAFRDLRLRARSRAPQGGFTLVEMMVVVGLLGVLAAVAVPSFNSLVADQRMRAGHAALNENLWLARAEAIKRNRLVLLAKGTSPEGPWTPLTVSDLSSSDWSVVVRAGATTQCPEAGETFSGQELRRQEGLPGLVATYDGGAVANGRSATFCYNPYGRSVGGVSEAWIAVTDSAGGNARYICFDRAGRSKFRKDKEGGCR